MNPSIEGVNEDNELTSKDKKKFEKERRENVNN